MLQRTYETRVLSEPDRDALLSAYAELYGRAKRTLFARLCAGAPLAPLKRAFLVRFGLTARQFNALAAEVRGAIAGIKARRPKLIASLERRIARAKKVLRTLRCSPDTSHQKRRRLGMLEQRLMALRADHAADRVRLCFGSRALFRAQFALKATGYASLQEWRRDWRAARAAQFLVLGSADETAGCQGGVATVEADGSVTLRLRLPDALARNGKYVIIPGLRFRYGHEAVVAAIGRTLAMSEADRQAISWRFVRDPKGWRVLVTVSVSAGTPLSVDNIGVVAVDLNADHLAVTDLDRFGNPVVSFRVPCATRGRTHHQTAAIIGDATNQVVTYACLREKPIVAERLDLEAKKAELEQRGTRYARLLSSFASATFHAVLVARCHDAGIQLLRVNPAFTSVIGAHKFADRYGLSRHHAAACSIGRRGMKLAERPNRRPGDRVTFPVPARTRGKHGWSFWRAVARRAAALRAQRRPGPNGARSSPAPPLDPRRGTARRGIRGLPGSLAPSAGGTPARESPAASFG